MKWLLRRKAEREVNKWALTFSIPDKEIVSGASVTCVSFRECYKTYWELYHKTKFKNRKGFYDFPAVYKSIAYTEKGGRKTWLTRKESHKKWRLIDLFLIYLQFIELKKARKDFLNSTYPTEAEYSPFWYF